MISILDINITGSDVAIIFLAVIIVPILFLVMLILSGIQLSSKHSTLLAKSQVIISALLVFFCLMILMHQLQGNIKEEPLISILSMVVIVISTIFFMLNVYKTKEPSQESTDSESIEKLD